MFEVFFRFWDYFYVFSLITVFFELLHAKPCRIIWKLIQKVSLGSEMCIIERKPVFQLHFFEKSLLLCLHLACT